MTESLISLITLVGITLVAIYVIFYVCDGVINAFKKILSEFRELAQGINSVKSVNAFMCLLVVFILILIIVAVKIDFFSTQVLSILWGAVKNPPTNSPIIEGTPKWFYLFMMCAAFLMLAMSLAIVGFTERRSK